MLPLTKGHYTARIAHTVQDIDCAQSLRHLCFNKHRGLVTRSTDADAFDGACQHILIDDAQSNTTVCTFRLLYFLSGATIPSSYSAQFYDLTHLSTYPAPMAELGRFCIHPKYSDPDILRLAWAALTRIVDAKATKMLFGCTSFDGADPAKHLDAFALLSRAHLAPSRWQPGIKSPHAYRFGQTSDCSDCKAGDAATVPPLLRTYLAMGGWVSDHAVIDKALNTLHVFTALEIATIPPNRARLLRSLAT